MPYKKRRKPAYSELYIEKAQLTSQMPSTAKSIRSKMEDLITTL